MNNNEMSNQYRRYIHGCFGTKETSEGIYLIPTGNTLCCMPVNITSSVKVKHKRDDISVVFLFLISHLLQEFLKMLILLIF